MRFVFLWLALMSASCFAASEITIEETYSEKPPTEVDKAAQYQQALAALVTAELKVLKLDPVPYEEGIKRHQAEWQKKYEARAKASDLPILPLQSSHFIQRESLFSRVILVKFAAKADQGDVWQMTLQGQAEPLLLQQHYQRMVKAGPVGKKLFLDVHVTPVNFSWEDLQLERPSDFIQPLEKEWLKWFADGRLPEGVDEIAFCTSSCQASLKQWGEFDQSKMSQFLAPELMESLLLSVDIKLEREMLGTGPMANTRISLTGGVVLMDVDSKRRLHWLDLNREQFTLKPSTPKDFNSSLATLCYRAPLGKFFEFKTLANQSALPRQSLVVRLENPGHMGQALRLLEWLQQKGKSMNVEGKLDSFKRHEARILIYFVGEGNKFKSLVSNVKELESEWGKPITFTDHADGPIYGLPGAAAKTSP